MMTSVVNISHATVMVIGFTERSRTVSASMAPPAADTFPLAMPLATLRRAERDHPMIFRLQVSISSAIVEPLAEVVDPLYDVVFGTRNSTGDPIEEFFILEALEDTIDNRVAFIRDDRRLEDQECFTIRIFIVDVFGRRELFTCNEDDSGADNYFCQTEICIEGKFAINVTYMIMTKSFRAICCWICGDNLHS